MNIGTDLNREIAAGAEVVGARWINLRPQSDVEVSALAAFCPVDQTVKAEIRWNEGRIVISKLATVGETGEKTVDGKSADRRMLESAGNPKLREIAAIRGVEWDKTATKETMIDRLEAAAPKEIQNG